MFDVSFSELMLIGVIALIVIGPERLPKVARTVGHLLGRAQRYVSEVKSDIQREIDLKEIGDIKNQMQDAARSVETSMRSSVSDLKAAVTEPTDSLRQALDEAREAVKPEALPPAGAVSATSAAPSSAASDSGAAPADAASAPPATPVAAEPPETTTMPGAPVTPRAADTASSSEKQA